jgi:hypothetical protein
VVPPPQTRPQTPAEQTRPSAQALLQAPQFDGSFLVFTQLERHSDVPPEHTSAHAPFTQLMPDAQALPQPPQFEASLCTSTQPSSAAQNVMLAAHMPASGMLASLP